MAFFKGRDIDTVKLSELSAQGLNVSQIAKAMGHSRSGIEQHCIKHSIEHTFADRCKWVNVNCNKMTVGDACALFGFARESLYAWRVKRGLALQEGFEAYVAYKLTKQTDKKILTLDSCTVIFDNKSYTLREISKKLNFNVRSLSMFMKHNRYTQPSFNRYCRMMGIR
jgi:hypothetical protein